MIPLLRTVAVAHRGGAVAAKPQAKVGAGAAFWALTVGSIGVVYGDIGTSPLYAMRESVLAAVGPGNPANETAIFGILSLIIWALILIVTLKYVVILLRADNNGEGGTLALMALAQRSLAKRAGAIVLCGVISAALFYGDAMITPALSVLSAIEGLKVATPAFDHYVVALTALILVVLFAFQSHGTAKVAAFFGPIMLVWFVTIALGGLWHVMANPAVLWAFNPSYGLAFLASHGIIGLVTLGAVFLVVTGSEALYADLVRILEKKPPTRVPGTAVFLTSTPHAAPTALMHSLKHYKVLHEHNVILTIETANTPRVEAAERVRMKKLGQTFACVTLRFGFMETPNVPKALAIARKLGWTFDIMSTSFFLSRRSLKPAAHSGMPRWQDRLFIMLTRIANDATDYFQIPTGRVVEVGTQVTI